MSTFCWEKVIIILLIEFFQDISENMFFMSAFLKHMFEIPGYNVS